MRKTDLPLALLVLAGVVALAPLWVHYLGEFVPATPGGGIAAGMALATLVILVPVSWVKPQLSGHVVAGALLVCLMALMPYWTRFVSLGSGALDGHPMTRTALRFALPILILASVVALGTRAGQ